MQSQSSVFDDLARLMTGAMGMAQGASQEAKSFMRAQADRLVAEMDLVSRDEFEAAKDMAAQARAETAGVGRARGRIGSKAARAVSICATSGQPLW